MASLRLTVSALADASLVAVFRPFVQEAARARQAVNAMFKGAAAEAAKGAQESANATVAAAARGAKAQVDGTKAAISAEKERARIAADLVKQEAAMRARDHKQFLDELREQEREAKKAAKSAAKEKREAAKVERANEGRAERVGSAAFRTFGGYMAAGAGVAHDVASGFGIDMSLAGGIGRSMSRNAMAIALSNAAYKDGGPREDVAGLESRAMGLGTKYGIDPTKVLAGLGQYQKLTGDLATGKAGLEGLTALAAATTTDLDHMMAAAGNVGNALGNGFKTPEEKAARILEVMKGVAAFGQEGAVEVSDLAAQMAKVAAAAGFFEGDRSKNLLQMTALAQLARQTGGASSSTQAATSVLAFANTLRTPARRKEFDAMGVKLDSATEKGQLRPIFDIIKDSIKASSGDLEKMKKMFANVVGDKGVTALLQAYNKAGGGAKGMAAVDAEIGRFSGTMSDAQIRANNEERLKGKEAQGVQFQVELDRVTSTMATELAPSMSKLAPVAKDAAQALAGIVSFGAQNPGAMIAAAIAASIGKAAIGEYVGPALTKALATKVGMGGGLAITAAAVTLMATQAIFDAKDAAATRGVNADLAAMDAATIGKIAEKTGKLSAKDKASFEEQAAKLGSRIEAAKKERDMMALGANPEIRAAKNYIFGGPDLGAIYQSREDVEKLPELEQAYASLQKSQDAVRAAKIENVGEIASAVGNAVGQAVAANMPRSGPGVDEGARSGGVR